MHTVQIKKDIKIGFDDLVQGVSMLNAEDLSVFFEKLNHALVGQKKVYPIGEEAILLKQIKTIIPKSVIRHFKELQIKQYNNSISEKELEDMLIITDFIEEKSAERVALLAELSKIRQIPLLDLVKQLDLKNYHT